MSLEQFSFLLEWLAEYENIDEAQHNLEHSSLSGFQFGEWQPGKSGRARENVRELKETRFKYLNVHGDVRQLLSRISSVKMLWSWCAIEFYCC